MKKLGTYTFIFILTFLSIFGNAEEGVQNESVISTAFENSSANMAEININSHVVIENQFISIDNARQICNDISERLNMIVSSQEEYIEEGFSQIIAQGTLGKNTNATIILQSSQFDDFKESSIVIDIIGTEDEYDLEEFCDKIRTVLYDYGKPNLNLTLIGYYNGFVDNKKLEDIVNGIFSKIRAKKVEGIADESLVSITGYTEKMKDFITVGGKKVNINIAGRYNSYEDKTYIWIGTPLIVTEY